jgi:ketosteroid isomerase-like protein
MSHNRVPIPVPLLAFLAVAVIASGCSADHINRQSSTGRNALETTSETIRAAFARGDIATIMACHHPEVVKSLSYGNYLIGRDAVQKDIAATLQRFNLEWKENQVRSLLIQGDTAVELTDFVIQGTPKKQGEPFLFKGRAMVVYNRYKNSPTGWASIREIIQPAT